MMYLAAILDFIVFLFCLVLMCFYIMIFGLPTVSMSNIRSSFLPWSTYHFLLEMVQKAVLRKSWKGICITSSSYSCNSEGTKSADYVISIQIWLTF
jgi:hypothetical protein